MQVSGQGRDGTRRMTTQDNLPQSKNGMVLSEEAAPNNCDRPQKHILLNAESKTLRCAQSGSCLCGSTSEWGRKGSERMTGREDGWEEEEVQKESPD